MLRGRSTLNLDAKGRLAVPAKYREALQETCASRMVVTVNPIKNDNCLLLYPEDTWTATERKLEALPSMDPASQAFKRLVLGHADDQELDGQGRIRISQELRDFAQLNKRVVLLGQANKFEIWSEEIWNSRSTALLDVIHDGRAGLSPQLENFNL